MYITRKIISPTSLCSIFGYFAKLKRMLEMLNAMQINSMQRIYLFEHFRAFEYAIFVCNYFWSSKITKCISQMFTLASFQSLACMDWASAQSVASIIGGMSDYRTTWFSIRLIYRAWVDFVCRFVAIRMQLYTFWNSSSDIRGVFLERDREREIHQTINIIFEFDIGFKLNKYNSFRQFFDHRFRRFFADFRIVWKYKGIFLVITKD